MLTPEQVFTPGRLPIKDTNVYSSRGDKERDFKTAVRRGYIPVVFGEYGVGKTSMARRNLLEADREGRLVYIESVSGKTLSDVFARCLEHVGYRVTVSTTYGATSGASSNAGLSIGFPQLQAALAVGAAESRGANETWTRELVVKSPTDAKILDICESRSLILLLDELHTASKELVADLSAFLKAVANRNFDRFRVVLLGTSSSASTLVQRDPGIDRILQEVPLPAMSDEEVRFIVDKGMSDLGIVIPAPQANWIVRISVGSPNIAQYLCLEVAEAAFPRPTRTATQEDCDAALASYVEKKAKRLNEQYSKAIETVGPKRLRKQVLRAISEIPDEYVTMDQLRARVTANLGEEVPSTSLSGPLRDLKNAQYGTILKDIDRPDDKGRVYNYTTFSDPAMKAFVRVKNAEDSLRRDE